MTVLLYLLAAASFLVGAWGWHGLRNNVETKWTLGAFLAGLAGWAFAIYKLLDSSY